MFKSFLCLIYIYSNHLLSPISWYSLPISRYLPFLSPFCIFSHQLNILNLCLIYVFHLLPYFMTFASQWFLYHPFSSLFYIHSHRCTNSFLLLSTSYIFNLRLGLFLIPTLNYVFLFLFSCTQTHRHTRSLYNTLFSPHSPFTYFSFFSLFFCREQTLWIVCVGNFLDTSCLVTSLQLCFSVYLFPSRGHSLLLHHMVTSTKKQ